MSLPINRFTALFAAIFIAAFLLQACGGDDRPTGPNFDTVPEPFSYEEADSSHVTDDGLEIYIVEEGHGQFEVIARDQISAYYTGRTMDGRIFDSTYRNGVETPGILRNLTSSPIRDEQTGQQVSPLIEGFRRGVIGMKEGEKRTIIIPPHLGYGDTQRGTNGYDLREDTLRFDVELEDIL